MPTLNTEEIYAILVNEHGWRILPDGNWVKLGDGVKLGNGVKLGDGVKLGNDVTLGDVVKYETTPCQVQCHPYIVYPHSFQSIGVGCITHELEYWLQTPAELANHPECLPWEPYTRAIALVQQWIEENRPREDAQ